MVYQPPWQKITRTPMVRPLSQILIQTCINYSLINLACSKRSDSGERCEVKKAMKSRGELGREIRYMKKTSTNTIITQAAPGSYASDFSVKQGEKRKRIDAIRNRISDFDRRRISQPKTQ